MSIFFFKFCYWSGAYFLFYIFGQMWLIINIVFHFLLKSHFARDKAEQADKLESEFLAQISHEIRSPINIISNYVSLIKEELNEKMNEVLDLSFIAIDKANNRIIRSIDMIINMS
jgi:signal transduction histidine kinase